MDSKTLNQAQQTQALIADQQRHLDRMDATLDRLYRERDDHNHTIGMWTVQRNAGRENLHELQSLLATLTEAHYSAMFDEAVEMARDKAQSFAEDFGGSAA